MKQEEYRLARSTVKIDEETVLITYTSNLLKVPYQFKLTSTKRKKPSLGNYYDYSIFEVNTGFGGTISQEKLLRDMNRKYSNYTEASNYLFGNDKNFQPNNINRFLEFNEANLDYYVEYLYDNGVKNITQEQVLQLCGAELMTLMAETLIITFQDLLAQTVEKQRRK